MRVIEIPITEVRWLGKGDEACPCYSPPYLIAVQLAVEKGLDLKRPFNSYLSPLGAERCWVFHQEENL